MAELFSYLINVCSRLFKYCNCEYFTPADHRIYKEINVCVCVCAVGNIVEGLY